MKNFWRDLPIMMIAGCALTLAGTAWPQGHRPLMFGFVLGFVYTEFLYWMKD